MNEQAFELITAQIARLEDKVDELLRWKHYFTGVAAIMGALFGGAVSILVAWASF